MGRELILASASPRRKELLSGLPWAFAVAPAPAEETACAENPPDTPLLNAAAKADAAFALHPGSVVLGADTVILLDNAVFGKPRDLDDARRMLRAFSGRTHEVVTAVSIRGPQALKTDFSVSSRVTFGKLSDADIENYLSAVPVLDKAGAYAVQSRPELLHASVDGPLDNVIGLPLDRVGAELEKLDLTFDTGKIPYFRRLAVLFLEFLKIAAFVIGGGYAIIPAAESVFCRRRRYVSDEDMLNMMVITQSVPGIIACNSAIFIGRKVAGFGGSLAAVVGAVLPSLVILSLIAAGLSSFDTSSPVVRKIFCGVIAGVTGMVAATGIRLGKKAFAGIFEYLIMLAVFAGMFIFKINAAYLILVAVLCGIILVFIRQRQAAGREGAEK